jgi:SAM-dependent methyltransferase
MLSLHTATQESDLEVREGVLQCASCHLGFGVRRGVAELLIDPPEHVRREIAGLERFAEHMRSRGWDRERILRLPEGEEDGYWYVQARSLAQLLETVDFQPGQSVLDVGSNTCWATNRLARAGLRAIALDISTAELQGLRTADVFIEAGTSYFERVHGTMNDMPIASGSLDYVYCCEVLHHNDLPGLLRTFREAHRVLKPGGKLLVINETLKCLRDRSGVHVDTVAHFEGYEHAHWARQYRQGARRAGFSVEPREPVYHPFFDAAGLRSSPGASPREVARQRLSAGLRRSERARRAYLAWLHHVEGGVMYSMIATKAPDPRPQDD